MKFFRWVWDVLDFFSNDKELYEAAMKEYEIKARFERNFGKIYSL